MTVRDAAVIFDLDGTLLDTLADIAASANEVLQSLGYPPHQLESYRRMVGSGVGRLFARALPPDAVNEAQLTECGERFREAYGRHWNVRTTIYPGIPELLDALQQRGLRMAVLSNKPDAFTQRCTDHYLARWPFEIVLGQRAGIPRKPHPAGALEILDHLAAPPQRCFYLGDADVDMQTATAAGLFPVGVLWGFRSAEELTRNGARALISHPMELLDLLTTRCT